MQNQNNTNPMETGSIPKLLAQLAIPAVVAQVINLLYNIVDRILRNRMVQLYSSVDRLQSNLPKHS